MTLTPRMKLVLLAGLFALPMVASFLAYRFFTPESTSNYGELLAPRPVTSQPLARLDGSAFRFTDLSGRWVMVASDSGDCAGACLEKLLAMRQVRLALGRKATRVERAFVVDDVRAPDPALAREFEGMHFVVTPRGLALPPGAGNDRAHVYLIDPRGNVMMRWPAAGDPKRMLRDMDRLLRASQIG